MGKKKKAKKAKPIWWEKTVEYSFVTIMAEHDQLALAPLAGRHELASDLMAACPKGMILIEFKRNKQSLNTEKSKFKNYKSAKKELNGKDDHHFLIYGSYSHKAWTLVAKNYFSPQSKDTHDLHTLVDKGIPYDDFRRYVERFIEHKLFKNGNNDDGDGDNSGGNNKPDIDPSGGPSPDYSLVAGISKEGKIVQCMTLDDFMMRADGPSLGGAPTPEPSPPNFQGSGRGFTQKDLARAVAETKETEKLMVKQREPALV